MENIILHCFVILLKFLLLLYYSQAVESQGVSASETKGKADLAFTVFLSASSVTLVLNAQILAS